MGKQSSLQSVLDKYPIFEETDRGKLVCTLTKHELPISEIANYVKSKKFLEQWETHCLLKEYESHFQDFEKGLLVCNLTKRTLTRDSKAIKNHVNGVRFKAALVKAKADAEKAALEAASAPEIGEDETQENGGGDGNSGNELSSDDADHAMNENSDKVEEKPVVSKTVPKVKKQSAKAESRKAVKQDLDEDDDSSAEEEESEVKSKRTLRNIKRKIPDVPKTKVNNQRVKKLRKSQ